MLEELAGTFQQHPDSYPYGVEQSYKDCKFVGFAVWFLKLRFGF